MLVCRLTSRVLELHAAICCVKIEPQRIIMYTKCIEADPHVDTDSSRGVGNGTTNSLRLSTVCRLLVKVPLAFRNRLPSPPSVHSDYIW